DDEENGIYHTHDRFGALWVNPYMRIMEQQTLSKSHGIYTNLVAEYKITNWLTYHVTGFARQSASSSANYDNAWINPTDPTSTRSANESSAWRLINRLISTKPSRTLIISLPRWSMKPRHLKVGDSTG